MEIYKTKVALVINKICCDGTYLYEIRQKGVLRNVDRTFNMS